MASWVIGIAHDSCFLSYVEHSIQILFCVLFPPLLVARQTPIGLLGDGRPIGRATPHQADWRPPEGGPPRQFAVYWGEVWCTHVSS